MGIQRNGIFDPNYLVSRALVTDATLSQWAASAKKTDNQWRTLMTLYVLFLQ